jgi:hypothetical protein
VGASQRQRGNLNVDEELGAGRWEGLYGYKKRCDVDVAVEDLVGAGAGVQE